MYVLGLDRSNVFRALLQGSRLTEGWWKDSYTSYKPLLLCLQFKACIFKNTFFGTLLRGKASCSRDTSRSRSLPSSSRIKASTLRCHAALEEVGHHHHIILMIQDKHFECCGIFSVCCTCLSGEGQFHILQGRRKQRGDKPAPRCQLLSCRKP